MFKSLRSVSLFHLLIALLATHIVFAGNPGISYQGRIFKPDGSALEGSAVQFRMQIRSPGSENCLLFEEIQTLNMSGSSGVFSLTLNDGTGTRIDTATYQLDRVFANRETMTLDSNRCTLGTTYLPNTGDGRKFIVYFKDESMGAYEPLPILSLNFAPQSMYALESQKLDKFPVTSVLRAVDVSGNPATAAAFDPAQLTNLNNLIAGTSTQYATATSFSSVQTFAKTTLPICIAGQVLNSDGTTLSCVTDSMGGSAAYSAITNATGTNTVNNAAWAQTWGWNSATSQNAMTMSADLLTSGSLLNVTSLSPSLNSTNGLFNVSNLGTTTTGVLARFQSNSAVSGSGLTVLTNGNVGIGTATPTSQLHVFGVAGTAGSPNGVSGLNITGGAAYASGNGNGGGIFLTGGAAAGTGTGGDITITSGAGTGSPTYTRGGNISILPGDGIGASTTLYGGRYNGGGAPLFALYGSGSITTGSALLSTSNSTAFAGNTGAISITTGTVSAGFSSSNAGNISITAGNGGNATSLGGTVAITAGNGGIGNNNGSNVTINPGAKGGTAVDGNVVLSNLRGSVGVGTASPTAKLNVGASESTAYASTSASISSPILTNSAALKISNLTNTGKGAYLGMSVVDGLDNPQNAYIGAIVNNSSFTPQIVFGVSTGISAYSERMRIDNLGNVGIGTSTPAEKLDVNGAIKLGTTTGTNAGTIRWDGTNFQGYNGVAWTNFVPNPPAATACDTTSSYSIAGTYAYTVPASFGTITIKVWGGGGGGGGAMGGSGALPAGSNGSNSSITSLSLLAGGGAGGGGGNNSGLLPTGGTGGSASGGTTNTNGSAGGTPTVVSASGTGGSSPNGGATRSAVNGTPAVGLAGNAPGGGGSGGDYTANNSVGAGGGGGSYTEKTFTTATLPPGTYISDIIVGAGGAPSGTSAIGGTGAAGQVTITCATAGQLPSNDRGILFWNAGSYDSATTFVYSATGKVGIGNPSPTGNLDVDNVTHDATICLNGICSATLGATAQTTVSSSCSVSAGSWCVSTSTCTAGYIRSGCSGFGPNHTDVVKCQPSSTNACECQFSNYAGTATTGTTYAYCVK